MICTQKLTSSGIAPSEESNKVLRKQLVFEHPRRRLLQHVNAGLAEVLLQRQGIVEDSITCVNVGRVEVALQPSKMVEHCTRHLLVYLSSHDLV